MIRVSVKALFIGAVVDLALSMVLGILAVLAWGRIPASRGKPLTATAQASGPDTGLLLIFLIIGLSSLALGGFVAGKIAGRDHVLHGALLGAVSLAIGMLIGGSGNPAWFTMTVVVLNIPTAIFGALLARRKNGNLVAGTASGG